MINVVSVVKDWEMYAQCVGGNPCFDGCKLHPVDNKKAGQSIPECYNSFIESCRDDCWIVFCHEDWEPLSPIKDIVEKLDKGRLHGVIGTFHVNGPFGLLYRAANGWVRMSRKDGSDPAEIRGFHKTGRVDTFDCQCVIAHSNLIKKHALRFDADFPFDLYVEDFCAAAYEKAAIESWTVALPSAHHSYGVLGERFAKTYGKLKEKYAASGHIYSSVAGGIFFGNSEILNKKHPARLHRPIALKLYQFLTAHAYWKTT